MMKNPLMGAKIVDDSDCTLRGSTKACFHIARKVQYGNWYSQL